MKKIKLVLIICFIIIMLSGCGSKTEEDSNINKGNTLVYGTTDYTSINPALYEHGEINSLLFDGLTAHGKNNEIIPAIAKSWDNTNEGKNYTFILRDDVYWHDGEKVTSEDVKFTIDAIKNPENGSEIASNYEEIEEVKIVSDTEVEIVLKESNVAILDYLTVAILPKHILDGKDLVTDSFNQAPIGTGPYKLEKWDIGQSITLVKNKSYFKEIKENAFEKIVFKIVPDVKLRAVQLKSGEIDFAQITPHDLVQFENDKNFKTYIMDTADYRGILYNLNSEFFEENKQLPNALSYFIDRKKIIDAVLLGHGEEAYSPLQAGSYYNSIMEQYKYNVSKGISELEKLGWKKNQDGKYEKSGQLLKFIIHCGEGDQVRIDMANICAQQLNDIGGDVTVKVDAQVDWANQEAYLIGWGSPFDPDDHTYKVFGTKKGSNFSGYENGEADRLLTLARQTPNQEDRLKYYMEFQEELTKKMPYTFLAYVDAVYVGNNKIQGIDKDAVLGHHGVGIFWNVVDWSSVDNE